MTFARFDRRSTFLRVKEFGKGRERNVMHTDLDKCITFLNLSLLKGTFLVELVWVSLFSMSKSLRVGKSLLYKSGTCFSLRGFVLVGAVLWKPRCKTRMPRKKGRRSPHAAWSYGQPHPLSAGRRHGRGTDEAKVSFVVVSW